MAKQESTLLTKEGLQRLEEELNELKTVRRREVASRLQEAISYGDLSENAEYEEAKNEQAFVEGRIREIEQIIKDAKVVSGKKTQQNAVNIGSTVTLKNQDNQEEETYTIVGTTEVSIFENKISNESPLGSALIGNKTGDTITYKSPGGNHTYKITKFS